MFSKIYFLKMDPFQKQNIILSIQQNERYFYLDPFFLILQTKIEYERLNHLQKLTKLLDCGLMMYVKLKLCFMWGPECCTWIDSELGITKPRLLNK